MSAPRPTVDEVAARGTLSVSEAAAFLGLGRDATYEAATAGAIPSLRIGRRVVIPAAPLLEMVGRPVVTTPKPDSDRSVRRGFDPGVDGAPLYRLQEVRRDADGTLVPNVITSEVV